MIGGPYNSGILATGVRQGKAGHYDYGNAPGDVVAKVGRIERLCADFGVPLPAAALQFPLAHPAVVSVIPGMARLRHVTETRKLVELGSRTLSGRRCAMRNSLRADAPLPDAGEAA